MKQPDEVKAIIAGTVYTVPTYTNIEGELVNGKNATVKIYSEVSSAENAGVNPLSLVKILADHFSIKSKLTECEEEALDILINLYEVLEENENEK